MAYAEDSPFISGPRSVAISGNGLVLAAGDQLYDTPSANCGAVYIYDWSGTAWVQRGGALTASDAASEDRFGEGLALSNDGAVLVVGARQWEGSLSNQGGVYVFDWSGSAWVQRGSVLTAPSATASAGFGHSLAISPDGTKLAVGSPTRSSSTGAAYVFTWDGSAWTQRGSTVTASDAGTFKQFGQGVGINGDGTILAVGSPTRDPISINEGGVYLYDWSGSAWVERGTILLPADIAEGDQFGYGVALDATGDVLLVGAPQRDNGASTSAGAVYLFDWSGSAWVQNGSPIEPNFTGNWQFGSFVGLSTDLAVLAIAAPGAARAYTFRIVGAATDIDYSAALASSSSVLSALVDVFNVSYSAALVSGGSSLAAEFDAFVEFRWALGTGYAIEGGDRNGADRFALICEVGGTRYPLVFISLRKLLQQLVAGRNGTETVDAHVPYSQATLAALRASMEAGDLLSLSAIYETTAGGAVTRHLGDFAITNLQHPPGRGRITISAERGVEYATSEEAIQLAKAIYETAESVRCSVDHQIYPGQDVRGHAVTFRAGRVTITLDATTAQRYMEVFANG